MRRRGLIEVGTVNHALFATADLEVFSISSTATADRDESDRIDRDPLVT